MMAADLVTTAGTSFGHGAVEALVEERFGPEDERTNARLDRLVKIGGRCRYCSGAVSDAALALHPEVCSARPCLLRARNERFVSELVKELEPPKPRREQLTEAGFQVAAPAEPDDPELEDEDEEEAMPANGEPERKLCTKCGTKPLRSDNKSGICSGCRAPWKKGGATSSNGKQHAVRPPPRTPRAEVPLTRTRSATTTSQPASRRRACA